MPRYQNRLFRRNGEFFSQIEITDEWLHEFIFVFFWLEIANCDVERYSIVLTKGTTMNGGFLKINPRKLNDEMTMISQ